MNKIKEMKQTIIDQRDEIARLIGQCTENLNMAIHDASNDEFYNIGDAIGDSQKYSY